MNVQILKEARTAMEAVQTTTQMLQEIDSLRSGGRFGHGGAGRGGWHGDPTCDAMLAMERLEKKLSAQQARAAELYGRAMDELTAIPNMITRNVFMFRDLYGMKWDTVARKLGENYSVDAVKMRYSRYLKNSKSSVA